MTPRTSLSMLSTLSTLAGLGATVVACSAAPTGETVAATSSAGTSYAQYPTNPSAAFGAADLASAYDIPLFRKPSQGTTIAIIVQDPNDWTSDDPNFEADLAVYRAAYGLGGCSQSTGCLKKLNENGGTTLPAAGLIGGGQKTAAALDMASAACPSCNLLVVDMLGRDGSDYVAAVQTAAANGAKVVVYSGWGIPDLGDGLATVTTADTAALGSSGATLFVTPNTFQPMAWPAIAPTVIAVGATNLDDNGPLSIRSGWEESAASQASAYSVCSQEPKPAWQHDTGCSGRTVVDVAAVGGPAWTFNTLGGDVGWVSQDSFTIATALVAGIFAQTGNVDVAPSYPYTNASLFNDVITGSEGAFGAPAYLYDAEVGYDGPTGNGTPNGLAMIGGAQTMVTSSAARLSIAPGQTPGPQSVLVGTDVQASAFGWPNPADVTFSISGLPQGVTATYVQTQGYIAPAAGLGGAVEFSASGSNGVLPTDGEQGTVVITATSGGVSYSVDLEVAVAGTCVPAACTTGLCGAMPNGCGGVAECGGCGDGACNANNTCAAPVGKPVGPPLTCTGGTRDCGGYCAKLCE